MSGIGGRKKGVLETGGGGLDSDDEILENEEEEGGVDDDMDIRGEDLIVRAVI